MPGLAGRAGFENVVSEMSKVGARILVVDDEEDILAIAQLLLENAGHKVVCAVGGHAAVQNLENSKFDLLITDMLMPEMDGVELINSARRLNPEQRIVAMSGGGHAPRESYLQIASMYGVNAVLPKPFNRQQLLDAINNSGLAKSADDAE